MSSSYGEGDEYEDSTGKTKSSHHNVSRLSQAAMAYLRNPITVPLVLVVVLTLLALDLFPFGNGTTVLLDPFFENTIDPQKYDFFAPTEQNRNLYNKINHYLSPNHEPLGFQNMQFSRVRTTPGSPPLVANPGIYPLNNLDPADKALKAITDNYREQNSFWKTIGYIFTLGGKLSSSNLPKRKIYIILGNSPNIGIEREISRQSWLIEKISTLNKKAYAMRHNYELILQNSDNNLDSTVRADTLDSSSAHQKRYQHESREGWQRFDIIRQAMRTHSYNNPHVEEWYWYLDMHTIIMQPERSLEEVVFSVIEKASRSGAFLYHADNLDDISDGDITWSTLAHRREFGRLDVDPESSKLTHKDIDLILTEDCYGMSLSSFLLRRSKWTELLLDMLWEPVMYRQMHTMWNKLERKDLPHKYGFLLNEGSEEKEPYRGDPSEMEERNCLEYFLSTQAWLRTRTAVLPARVFNSLSNDSCVIDPESTLDLIDMEMDDDLIDALLDSDDLDLLIIKEKLSANAMSSKFKELTARVHDLHYETSDFLFSFSSCRDCCENHLRDAMTWYKAIHGKQLFDDF